MTEHALDLDAADGSTVARPTHTLTNVIDIHHVWLRGLSGHPLVPKRYGSTKVVVSDLRFTWTRNHPRQSFRLTEVVVIGSRAKKAGGPSEVGVQDSYTGSVDDIKRGGTSYGSVAEWIFDLAMDYAPLDPAANVCAFIPPAEAADSRPPFVSR